MAVANRLSTYRAILEGFLEAGYAVQPAGIAPLPAPARVLYLRHDIDYSPRLALEMARTNAALGIVAAFHVPVRSPLFNLGADAVRRALDAVRECGQQLALHFYLPEDPAAATLDHDAIGELAAAQHRLLAALVGPPLLDAFSWHNPSLLQGAQLDWVQAEYATLFNVNALARRGVDYVSDSNNRLSDAEWLAAPGRFAGQVQALFHPFQWVNGGSDVGEVLAHSWCDILRDQEAVFRTNHVYRARRPHGLGEADWRELAGLLHARADDA
jgi:hypothetical protein